MKPSSRIYLVGYRCTGKTTVGNMLAIEQGMQLHDLDRMIENQEGKTIKQIWDDRGEEAFRDYEQQILEFSRNLDNAVIATGGGIVERDANRDILKEESPVIWLRAEPDTIRERMSNDDDQEQNRPPLTDTSAIDEIEEVLTRRRPLYEEVSDLDVETDTKAPEEVVQEILHSNAGEEE